MRHLAVNRTIISALLVILSTSGIVVFYFLFINAGFTGEEGATLALLSCLPIITIIGVFHFIFSEKNLPLFSRRLHRPFIKGWEPKTLILLTSMFITMKAYKYLQMGDLFKAFLIIIIPATSIYIFLILVNIAILSKQEKRFNYK